ncbi:MAG TPA: S41 family peptidase [Verrucomicrobiae bacterium]|jgi:carboxyl-terminal processing protease
MKRRLFYGALVAILLGNLLFGAQVFRSSVHGAEKDEAYPNLKLFSIVLDRVRNDYVDGAKLTYQDLIYGALKGMLNTLDPHSEFMEPIKYDDLKKDTSGEFGGVGIVVSVKDNYLTVIAPMEDTPGFKAGILTGDRIIKIDGKSTEKFSLPDAVKRLRGEPGTDVTVTVLRPSNGQVKEYKLTRSQIKVDTVKDINGKREFPLSENNVGYIRIMQFGEATASDLEDALRKLEAKNVEALVMDLRGNPGGLLDQAVKVCEKFLPRGQLVVSTEGRDAKQKSEYRATGREKHGNLPMVILVNNGSASASEIVAGCLQDTTALGLTKAIIVGEQTFGKGSVQSILPLQDGSALRLTTAKYYTPSHKVIHEKGITPDIVVAMSDEEERDVYLKRTPGGIEALDPVGQERVKNAHDAQLDRAMDLLKGISLYSKRAPAPEKPRRTIPSEKVAVK